MRETATGYESDQLSLSDGRTWQVFVTPRAQLYTVYGKANKITSEMTKVEGKNIGRSNETSALEQALKQATSMVTKKIKSGYSQKNEVNLVENRFPMAVSAFDPKKIKFPCMMQAKLDGIRMIANDKILSRRLHDIEGFGHIKQETDLLRTRLPSNYFVDGELYVHGLPLQEISGIVRGSDAESKMALEYHVFDFASTEGIGFQERIKILQEAAAEFDFSFIKIVPAILASSQEESDDYFGQLTSEGYEGIIYKQINSLYEASDVKEKRSTKCVKRKTSLEEEFKIEDFSQGVGKFQGAVVFTLSNKDGIEFQCVPIGSMEYRKQLYADCLRDFRLFKHKLATVRFDAWSVSGVPLRGVIVNIDRLD